MEACNEGRIRKGKTSEWRGREDWERQGENRDTSMKERRARAMRERKREGEGTK